MLPNEIFSLGLKPRDLTVLACLIRHKEECCVKEKTVDAALKVLEERSIIVKRHRLRENGSHTSNMYFIADVFAMTQRPAQIKQDN